LLPRHHRASRRPGGARRDPRPAHGVSDRSRNVVALGSAQCHADARRLRRIPRSHWPNTHRLGRCVVRRHDVRAVRSRDQRRRPGRRGVLPRGRQDHRGRAGRGNMTATPAAGPMRRSSRDPEVLRARLESWLATRVDAIDGPRVDNLSGTDANGMSSDTVLFDAHWTGPGGTSYDEELVARLAPDLADVPVFPRYDMTGQFNTIKGVHELTDVPVPEPRWCET